MTVGELLDRVDRIELLYWKAYELKNGPLGPARGDWQAAVIAKTVVDVMAGKKGRRSKITNFLLTFGRAGDHNTQRAEVMGGGADLEDGDDRD